MIMTDKQSQVWREKQFRLRMRLQAKRLRTPDKRNLCRRLQCSPQRRRHPRKV